MSRSIVIAIDGPAASGKSTVARRLADELGFTYVNTGTMYRAITWQFLEENLPMEESSIIARIQTIPFEVWIDGGHVEMRINGIDPVEYTREERVNGFVPKVATIPEVRQILTDKMRSLAKHSHLVMEGRDIGSVVFPQTPYKFFIDADEAIRNKRRMAQGEIDEIQSRDKIDSSRKSAPLQVATGAVRIDTTQMTVDQVMESIYSELPKMGLVLV